MPTRSALTVLLLTGDSDLQEHFKRSLKDATLIVAKDMATLGKSGRRSFDGVIVETRRGGAGLREIEDLIDPHQTFVLAGSRTVLTQAAGMLNGLAGHHTNGTGPCLDEYLESKLRDFVKGMKI